MSYKLVSTTTLRKICLHRPRLRVNGHVYKLASHLVHALPTAPLNGSIKKNQGSW